jgi:hypothetical protein
MRAENTLDINRGKLASIFSKNVLKITRVHCQIVVFHPILMKFFEKQLFVPALIIYTLPCTSLKRQGLNGLDLFLKMNTYVDVRARTYFISQLYLF